MMYSNNIMNFQGSTTILNACTKKKKNLETYWMHQVFDYNPNYLYFQTSTEIFFGGWGLFNRTFLFVSYNNFILTIIRYKTSLFNTNNFDRILSIPVRWK